MRTDEIHPGDVIAGKYRVRTILGRNHGLLVEGFHTEFDQRVVIKVLLAGHGDDRELERFRREARTLSKLESEHVARIIDVGTEPDGSFFLVRQHLDGVDLGSYIRQNGALALPDAVLSILMVAEAVAETHSHGIMIRELQPDHLFLTQRAGGAPLVKITDFGTAKLMRDSSAPSPGGELTATAMFGLSPYSSPELLRKAKNVDVRTDVWSLGAIFYELLTGRAPFTGETAMLMLQITKENPPPPSQVRSDLPPEIDQIVSWALAKDVDARFKNVHAFAHALQPYATPEGQVLIDRIRQITEASRTKRRGGSVPPATFPGAPAAVASAPTGSPLRRSEESVTNIRSPQSGPPAAGPGSFPPRQTSNPSLAGAAPAAMAAAPVPPAASSPAVASSPSMSIPQGMPTMTAQAMQANSSASRKLAMGALAVAAVVLPLTVLLVLRKAGSDTTPTSSATAMAETAPTTAPATSAAPVATTVPSAASSAAASVPVTTADPVAMADTPPTNPGTTRVARPSSPGGTKTAPDKGAHTAAEPATPPPANPGGGGDGGDGTLLAVAIGGNCSFSVNGTSKGTADKIRVSLKPGTYSVACKPPSGAMKTKSVTIKSGETYMSTFKVNE